MMDLNWCNAPTAVINDFTKAAMGSEFFQEATAMETESLEKTAFEYLLDVPPPPAYSLWTTDEQAVCLGGGIWKSSPVLTLSCPNGERKYIEATSRTVNALVTLHSTGVFPDNMKDLLNLFSLAKRLQLRRCLRLCFDFYYTGEISCGNSVRRISDCPFPPDCHPASVLSLWEMLCESPPRALDRYDKLVRKLCSWSEDAQFRREVAKIFEQINSKRRVDPSHHSRLPFDFEQSSMTIAIVRQNEYRFPAMLKAGKPEAVDIAKLTYCGYPGGVITDFYLILNSYIIFRNTEREVLKKIWKPEPRQPCRLARNVLQFVVKNEHLLILQKEKEYKPSRILKWTGSAMFPLKTVYSVGNRCDFCPTYKRLCYVSKDLNFVSVESLRSYQLTPVFRIDLTERLTNLTFFENLLYLFMCDGEKHFVTECINSEGEEDIGHANLRQIKADISDSRAEEDQLFLKFGERWHCYTGGRLQRLPGSFTFEAINGVSMNPYICDSGPL